MIITGLREIKKYLTKEKDNLNGLNLEIHYVKPFPPNLYLKIINFCKEAYTYSDQQELKELFKLKAKTNILLKNGK